MQIPGWLDSLAVVSLGIAGASMFMMQLAMVLGFLTSYPVNWWLLKKKIKEAI